MRIKKAWLVKISYHSHRPEFSPPLSLVWLGLPAVIAVDMAAPPRILDAKKEPEDEDEDDDDPKGIIGGTNGCLLVLSSPPPSLLTLSPDMLDILKGVIIS